MHAVIKGVCALFVEDSEMCGFDDQGRIQGLPEEGPQRTAYVDAAIAAALALFPEDGGMAAAADQEPISAATRLRLMVCCISSHRALRPCSRNSSWGPALQRTGP